jgi:hypothetical protein
LKLTELRKRGKQGAVVMKLVKVEFTLQRAMKAQRGSRGIAVLFL